MNFLRYLRDAAVFAPCYVALDRASYIDPLGPFNITPVVTNVVAEWLSGN